MTAAVPAAATSSNLRAWKSRSQTVSRDDSVSNAHFDVLEKDRRNSNLPAEGFGCNIGNGLRCHALQYRVRVWDVESRVLEVFAFAVR